MKKILFLNSFYYPKYNVNGICSNEIIKVLKDNYEIYTLSYKNLGEKNFYNNDGEKIYKVRPRLFFLLRDYSECGKNKFAKMLAKYTSLLIQKVKRILYFFNYPVTSLIAIYRYTKAAKKIVEMHNIDTVISVFQPFETIVAANYLKKKYSVKEIIYVLDTLSNENKKNNLINRYKKKMGRKAEKKYYEKADLIISMRCHENNFNDSFYDDIREKLVFSDIPLLRTLKNNNKEPVFDTAFINLVYTGTLDKERRDPTKICELIQLYNNSNNPKIIAHFFSRGDCEDILKKYKCVERHGFVKNDISVNALFSADALISVEAKNSDMISAKIFEYMSTGKKIIHFNETESDVLLPYLRRYNNTLIINMNNNIHENIQLINNFINNYNAEKIQIEKVFFENTPNYTAKIIDDFIGDDKNA